MTEGGGALGVTPRVALRCLAATLSTRVRAPILTPRARLLTPAGARPAEMDDIDGTVGTTYPSTRPWADGGAHRRSPGAGERAPV